MKGSNADFILIQWFIERPSSWYSCCWLILWCIDGSHSLATYKPPKEWNWLICFPAAVS